MSTRRPSVRRLLAAACAPVLLIALAGCGTDDGKGRATDEPTTLQSGDSLTTADFASLVSSSVGRATTAHMVMDMTVGDDGGVRAEGDVSYEDGTPSVDMSMTVPADGGQIEVVMVGTSVYMKIPGLGRKYVGLDLSDSDTLPPEVADMVDWIDPRKSVEELRDAVDEVTYAGTDAVDGEALEHYLVTVDTSKIDQLSAIRDGGVDVPDTVDYDLWLDADGRMRTMKTDLEIMGTPMTIEVAMDDWGKDVSIQAPPKSQVRPMPSLAMAG